ncbi:MAG: hypothetical protein AAGF84_04555 [Planctomycetota bacterium]
MIVGADTTLRFTVANVGDADATVQPGHDAPWWTDAAFLSTDATLDDDDPKIGQADALPRLSRGGTYDVTIQATLPEDATPASAYVLLMPDYGDAVDEAGGEANNIMAVPVEVRPAAETPTDPVLGEATAAPRITVAWISHEAFEQLRAGPEPSETIQPALQRDATRVPNAPLRAGNTEPTPPSPAVPETTADATPLEETPTSAPPIASDVIELSMADGEPSLTDASETPSEAEGTDEPGRETPPETMESETPTPTVAETPSDPAPPAAQPTPEDPRPSSPPQGDTDADLADLEPVPVFQTGRVEVAEGLKVTPSRPDFSVPAIIASIPRNPRVRITFDIDGTVLDADLIDTAGSDMLDAPIRASLYRWRASGERLADWAGPKQFTFTILLTHTKSPTP